MSTQTEQAPQVRAAVFTVGVLVLLVIAIAAANALGYAERDLTKRAAGAMFGIILAAAGNVLPKLVRPLSERRDPAAAMAAERFAGRGFVLAGIAIVPICLLAPLPYALPLSAVIGLGAFGLIAANRALRAPGEPLPHPLSAQGAMLQIFHALLWVFAMFAADWIWGDAAAKWMVVAFSMAQGLLYAALVAAAKDGEHEPG